MTRGFCVLNLKVPCSDFCVRLSVLFNTDFSQSFLPLMAETVFHLDDSEIQANIMPFIAMFHAVSLLPINDETNVVERLKMNSNGQPNYKLMIEKN